MHLSKIFNIYILANLHVIVAVFAHSRVLNSFACLKLFKLYYLFCDIYHLALENHFDNSLKFLNFP